MASVLLPRWALGGSDRMWASSVEDTFVIPIWSDVVGGTAEKEYISWILNGLEFWHEDTGRPCDSFVDSIGSHKLFVSPTWHADFDGS